MDAFYASVEQLDNPDLKGKPIAVGGGGPRGVVSAASYEARKFGVRSAMASALAIRKCPDLIFVKPRFSRYKEISLKIRSIFLEYTDLVEPLSLDEAFLDVSLNQHGHSSATEIAQEIRDKILQETGLTASAGISINKFMAKIASDINKPNGQKTIKPKEVIPFLERLPIYKFFGVGKATAKRMNSWGIYNGYQLKQHGLEFLIQNFGKSGTHFYNIVRGIQNSPVRPNRERKSVGAERTYPDNLKSDKEILEKARWICEEIQKRLLSIGTKGRTITLKIKFSDFQQQTRSKTLNEAIDDEDQIYEIVKELVDQEEIKKSVRLVGVSLSNLENEQRQEEETITKKDSQLKLEF
ncbi:MAG: DNA polymerase IV [Flavobacteriales bacterium]|nr:DNA polymerase IV [Flavobacteriales bacterium]